MATAFRCDKCGEFVAGKAYCLHRSMSTLIANTYTTTEVTASVLVTKGDITLKVDFCKKCTLSLIHEAIKRETEED